MYNCNICHNNNILKYYTCLECNKSICNECIEHIEKKYNTTDNNLFINYKCPYCNIINKINIFNDIVILKDTIKNDFIKLLNEKCILENNLKLIKLLEKEDDDTIDQYHYQYLNQIECLS